MTSRGEAVAGPADGAGGGATHGAGGGATHGAVVLALDVGASKLAAGLIDETGRLLAAARTATPADASAEALFAALVGLGREALAATGGRPAAIVGIGVGCGGPMRWPAGEVSPLNIAAWRGFPLRRRLADGFRVPVRLHNDAACLAAGEHWRGAGRGHSDVLGMVVSSGVGGGLVMAGRLVDGASGNAGHLGHVEVEPGGPRCGCGRRGCLEAVARGPATVAWARAHGWRPGRPDAGGAELVAAAAAGDAVAAAALARSGRAVGRALASVVAVCDPAVVVVGGGLAQAGRWLFDPLRAGYAEAAGLEFLRTVPVLPAALGQHAGLYGAAALLLAGDRYWSGD